MKHFPIIIILSAIAGIAVVSCVSAGNATGPTTGTVRTFDATEGEVNSAIVNSFTNGHYGDMLLGPAIGSGELVRGWHPTNGFVLMPGTGTRYYGYFHIIALSSATTNQTKVVVQTLEANVVAGKEPGLHGGWALHFRKIPPVLQEETNILAEISRRLNSDKK